ncbi:MAG: tRNA pseudouridine(38-40) synthase TruA, partial [Aquabacterium sp.]
MAPVSRLALGLSYRGGAYQGWQTQPGGRTVQDRLEAALAAFAAQPVTTVCAGRTDAGVHGVNQVVHIDPPV